MVYIYKILKHPMQTECKSIETRYVYKNIVCPLLFSYFKTSWSFSKIWSGLKILHQCLTIDGYVWPGSCRYRPGSCIWHDEHFSKTFFQTRSICFIISWSGILRTFLTLNGHVWPWLWSYWHRSWLRGIDQTWKRDGSKPFQPTNICKTVYPTFYEKGYKNVSDQI